MTKEDKQLLLAELCARLPYGIKYQVQYGDKSIRTVEEIKLTLGEDFTLFDGWTVEEIKPYIYLRPMSSMTEEEYKSVSWEGCSHTYNYSSKSGFQFVEIKTFTLNILNWLNTHHFDYRGLIPKGLAIEAPKGMYKEEQK